MNRRCLFKMKFISSQCLTSVFKNSVFFFAGFVCWNDGLFPANFQIEQNKTIELASKNF